MNKLKNIPNWVLWKLEKRAGQLTKIPYSTNGEKASSTNSKTWTSYEEVNQKRSGYSGIGFVLNPETRILFIDLDKCLKDGVVENKVFRDFIDKAKTFTEISPSGTGLHLFLEINGDLKLTANRSKKCPSFECYNTGRYATITENIFEGRDTIRKVSLEEASHILGIVGYPWKEKEEMKETNTLITEDVLIDRMFKSKNGADIQKLYNGDISKYNDDESSADMALCMHLSFWLQKDTEKIRRVWLSSPLGKREKTQKRKDYQDRTIIAAINKCKEVYKLPESKNTGLDLMSNDKGVPHVNSENVARIIRHDELMKKSFRFNSFFKMQECSLSGQWSPLEKHHIIFAQCHLQQNYPYFEKVAFQKVEDAIILHSMNNPINEPKQFVESLEWDGEHRLNHWLSRVFGVEDNEYHSSVGANWLKGLVQRIIQPGCQFDYMLILEGPQGWRKTTAMRVLGKGYHVETVGSIDNKDFYMILLNNVIVEFSEGETLSRSEIKQLKSVITTKEDQIRLPYARNVMPFPRHCVFAMTTNQSQYFKDETGNRRFLPVVLEQVADIEWLENNVDQLYAEAYHRIITKKETTYEFPEEEMKRRQMEKMIDDPYVEEVARWYASLSDYEREKGITVLQVYNHIYQRDFPTREMSKSQSMIIADQLKHSLFLEKKRKMVDGMEANRWYATSKTVTKISSPVLEDIAKEVGSW